MYGERDGSLVRQLGEDLDGGLDRGTGDGFALALDADDREQGGNEVVGDSGGVCGRALSGSNRGARGGSDGGFRFCGEEDDMLEEEGESELPHWWYRSAVRPDFVL